MLNLQEKRSMFITSMISIAFALAIMVPWSTDSVLKAEVVVKVWVLPVICLVMFLLNLSSKYRNYRPSVRFTTVATYMPVFTVSFAVLFNALLMLLRGITAFSSHMSWLWMVMLVAILLVGISILTHVYYRAVVAFSKNEAMIVDAIIGVFFVGILFLCSSVANKYQPSDLQSVSALFVVVPIVFGLLLSAIQVLSMIRLYIANAEYQVESKKALLDEFLSIHKREYDKAELHILQNLFKYSRGQLGIKVVANEQVAMLVAEKEELMERVASLEEIKADADEYREKLLALQEKLAELQIKLAEAQLEYANKEKELVEKRQALVAEKEEFIKSEAKNAAEQQILVEKRALFVEEYNAFQAEKKALDDAKAEVEQASKALEDAKQAHAENVKHLEEDKALHSEKVGQFEEAKALHAEDVAQFEETKALHAEDVAQFEEAKALHAEDVAQFEEAKAKLLEEQKALEEARANALEELKKAEALKAEAAEELEKAEALKAEAMAELQKLEEAKAEHEDSVEASKLELALQKEKHEEQVAEFEKEKSEYVPPVVEVVAPVVEVKPKEAKPKVMKVIKPSYEELIGFVKAQDPTITVVANPKETMHKVSFGKKVFLIMQRTNNDYRITFLAKTKNAMSLINKYPGAIVKPTSPKGENWFKITNKGDLEEKLLNEVLVGSFDFIANPDPKPTSKKKVFKPAFDKIVKFATSIPEKEITTVANAKGNQVKFYTGKKLFLVAMSTNNDYRLTFCASPDKAYDLIVKYPGVVTKATSPKGDQWFKLTNKSEFEEKQIKAMIKGSIKYYEDLEAEAIRLKEEAKAEKEAEKARIKAEKEAEKARIKAEKEAEKAAQKAKEQAQKEAIEEAVKAKVEAQEEAQEAQAAEKKAKEEAKAAQKAAEAAKKLAEKERKEKEKAIEKAKALKEKEKAAEKAKALKEKEKAAEKAKKEKEKEKAKLAALKEKEKAAEKARKEKEKEKEKAKLAALKEKEKAAEKAKKEQASEKEAA